MEVMMSPRERDVARSRSSALSNPRLEQLAADSQMQSSSESICLRLLPEWTRPCASLMPGEWWAELTTGMTFSYQSGPPALAQTGQLPVAKQQYPSDSARRI